jgi:hypothetical protein
MELVVDGLPLLPGLLFGLSDVVGQLGPFEVEGQQHSLLLWLGSYRAGVLVADRSTGR